MLRIDVQKQQFGGLKNGMGGEKMIVDKLVEIALINC
jgi:hypothetical protein